MKYKLKMLQFIPNALSTFSGQWTMPIREWFILLSRFCLKALSNQLANQWIGSQISLNDSFSSLPHALTESSEAIHSDNINSRAMKTWLWIYSQLKANLQRLLFARAIWRYLLDEHRVCCLLFHRYRPRYHYDITSLLYMYHIKYNV